MIESGGGLVYVVEKNSYTLIRVVDMRSIYWFRSDLRISDNLALAKAMQASDSLMGVFILTPDTWKAHDAAPCKVRFLLENVSELSKELWKYGVPLLIRRGPSFSHCPSILDKLCKQ